VTGQRFLAFLDKDMDQEKTLAGALAFYGDGWTFTPDEPEGKPRGPNGRPRR
jgi:hypothetical protein